MAKPKRRAESVTVLRGVEFVDGTLVHHSGTMIRFVTSQLLSLPSSDQSCSVLLPDGQEVQGRWHPHPENPYLAGPALVRWIKSWIPYGGTEPARVYQIGTRDSIRVELRSSHVRISSSRPIADAPSIEALNRLARRLARNAPR